jgi:hypothetical protein
VVGFSSGAAETGYFKRRLYDTTLTRRLRASSSVECPVMLNFSFPFVYTLLPHYSTLSRATPIATIGCIFTATPIHYRLPKNIPFEQVRLPAKCSSLHQHPYNQTLSFHISRDEAEEMELGEWQTRSWSSSLTGTGAFPFGRLK